MKNILSIDLDGLWTGTDTIYQDKTKKTNADWIRMLSVLPMLKYQKVRVSIDHHELCDIIDQMNDSCCVFNLDAHHDLYGFECHAWLNPWYIRGTRISVGNFFLQLLREGTLKRLVWLLPEGHDPTSCRTEVIRQIGSYYANYVDVRPLENFEFDVNFNMVFICISPEWIPVQDQEKIKAFLIGAGISEDTITGIMEATYRRWNCGDDNKQIILDRFRFKHSFKR